MIVPFAIILTLLLSQLEGSPNRETKPPQACELYNNAKAVFLGRVLELKYVDVPVPPDKNQPHSPVRSEAIRVAVLERFKGAMRTFTLAPHLSVNSYPWIREKPVLEMLSEVTLIPQSSHPWLMKPPLAFSPHVEVGTTYLFYADSRYSNFMNAQAVVPVDQAPIEELRRLQAHDNCSVQGRVD